jgi:hypothetical protein
MVRAMSVDELFQLSVDAGIYTSGGKLTSAYGGTPAAGRRRRPPAAAE